MQQEVLPLRAGLNFMENKWQEGGEVSTAEVAEGVGSSRFNLLAIGGEGVQNSGHYFGEAAQITVQNNLYC